MKNLGGFVATVPHKTVIAALCDELGDAGRAIGSVNVVRREADGRLIGNMFDGAGFVAGLRAQGHDPAGRRALLVGAGGAAGAIAFALAEAGVASLTIANRTRSKAEEIMARVTKFFPDRPIRVGTADPTGHDLVINATSLGLKAGDPLPIDTDTVDTLHDRRRNHHEAGNHSPSGGSKGEGLYRALRTPYARRTDNAVDRPLFGAIDS